MLGTSPAGYLNDWGHTEVGLLTECVRSVLVPNRYSPMTFAWKREMVSEAIQSGGDSNEPPQLSLFASKRGGTATRSREAIALVSSIRSDYIELVDGILGIDASSANW